MAVALFGAGGRTGSLVLEQARKRGWPVRVVVRTAGKVAEDDLVKVVQGDARDSGAIDEVLLFPGGKVGAVICALGMHDIAVPATDFSDSVKAIVAGIKRHGVRRIVAIASAGVFEHPAGGYRNQQSDFPAYLRNVSAEHVRNYETLRDSGLDWTLMCPLTLVDDIPAGTAKWLYGDVPGDSGETGCADLAKVMCDLLAERASMGQRVGIVSYRGGVPT